MDHKKRFSSLNSFNSIGQIRNSISVGERKKDFKKTYENKFKGNNLNINTLNLSHNKEQ